MTAPKIEGYKGGKGGGGGSGAVIASDSLRSKAFARVIDLLCEGEIEGLVDGSKSIYLDDTPVQNADGSYNFPNVNWTSKKGTQSQISKAGQLQGYIPGFADVQNVAQINTEIKAATPVTRTFTNANLSAVLVTLGFPSLTSQDLKTGNVKGTSVGVEIYVQTDGGGFIRQNLGSASTINGKTSSRYQRSFRVSLTGSGPWDIRVVRLTPDSTTDALQNKSFWDTATEIIDAKLRYPNSAIVGISVDASQFSNIPTRGYDVKLLRVRVPSNYNPTTRAYTGSWDGTFKVAWTDNPAWCFYDLVTSVRYGLGAFVSASQVDKWALYSIAQYCDQLVPDGFGGYEPRFTCNLYLQTRAEAYQVIQDMASIFRGIVFWSSGAITATQDAPATPAALFAPANVIDGMFAYSGSSAKARHTVALVTWNDPSDLYRQKVEYVEDLAGIARFGIVTTEIVATGCTSRGQANRVGRWLLFSERLETETVTFKTGIEGMVARPGQVIKIADPGRAGVRYGGRLAAVASASSVTLDAPVDLGTGGFTLSTIKADGTVQDATVTSTGVSTVLTLSPAFAEAPSVGGIWMLTSTSVNPQTFRVISVVETTRGEFELTALAHDPQKFDAVELGLKLEPRSISTISAIPATPTGLLVTDSLYQDQQGVQIRMSISWNPVETAVRYGVTVKRSLGNAEPELLVSSPSLDIDAVQDAYTISVYSINAVGLRSATAATTTYSVIGKTAPPSNVEGFVVTRSGSTLNFTWRQVTDLDLDRYEIRSGQSWATGVPVGSSSSNVFSWSSPRGGTFMLKAVDTTGNYSQSEAVVIAPDVSGINVALTSSESVRLWSGDKSNVSLVGFSRPLQWSDLSTWDAWGAWNDSTFDGGVLLNGSQPWSSYSQPWSSYSKPWVFLDTQTSGTYVTQPIDIGYKATCAVTLENVVQIITNNSLLWSDLTQPWSFYAAPDWTWQGPLSGISVLFEVSTSDDNITWTQYRSFSPGNYTLRYMRIRATMTTQDPGILPYLTRLIVRIDVPDRVAYFSGVAVPSAGATLTFSPAFVGVQTVQVTLQSAASGDRYTVTGKSATGVTVNIFDSTGNPKAGTADVNVFGYGEKY